MTNNFAQSFRLVLLNLRKDWLKLTLWLVALLGLFAYTGPYMNTLYGTKAELDSMLETLNTPSMVAMLGKIPHVEKLTTAIVFGAEMNLFMSIMAAIMSVLIVVKNTRGAEEDGLVELLRARPVGRSAVNFAAVIELVLLNVFYAIGIGLLVGNSGINGGTMKGAFLLGFVQGAMGLLFGMLAILLAQIFENSRTVSAASFGFIGVFYILTMINNVQDLGLDWISPFSWLGLTQPYIYDDFAPLLYFLAATVILVLAVFRLARSRDVGVGLIAQRPGKSRAGFSLRGVFSLRFRLERSGLIWWSIAALIFGATYGSIFGSFDDLVKNNETLAQLIGATQQNALSQKVALQFVSLLAVVFAVMAIIFGSNIIHKIKTEQSKGMLELLESKAVSRFKLFASYLSVSFVGAAIVFLAGLYGIYAAGNSVLAKPIEFSQYWEMYLAYLPAIAIFLGISLGLTVFATKLYMLNWLYVVFGFGSIYFGGLFDLDKSIQRFTPFGWVKSIPVKDLDPTVTIWLSVIAIGLILVSVIGYRRKDLV